MKKLCMLLLSTLILLNTFCYASTCDNAKLTLRDKQLMYGAMGRANKQSMYATGRYILQTSKVVYSNSVSSLKFKHHQARIAAYNAY